MDALPTHDSRADIALGILPIQ